MFPALVVIPLCAALVAIGVVIVVRWGDGVPEPSADRAARTPAGTPLMLLARYGAIMAASGVVAGVLAAGAGGRIAMRVLALSSSDLRGTITEGGAVIGDITIGGTASFIFFVGLTSGLLSGALYAVLFPLLPRGRAGGLLLGLTLLVLAGSRIEPLRADNSTLSSSDRIGCRCSCSCRSRCFRACSWSRSPVGSPAEPCPCGPRAAGGRARPRRGRGGGAGAAPFVRERSLGHPHVRLASDSTLRRHSD